MIQSKGPYHYHLELSGPDKARFIKQKTQNGVVVNFNSSVTNNKTPKIYIIQKDGEILYVGYAGQPIANRFRGGLNPKGVKGYHGYKWKDCDKVTATIFVFDAFNGNEEIQKKQKKFVEAIEAELVYLVRSKTGVWPSCQNEIHFNNESPEEVRAEALRIYNLMS